MTALIAAYIEHVGVDVNAYYSEKSLTSVYKKLNQEDAKKIIRKANNLRKHNPLVHSSSEMLGMPDWTESIKNTIDRLTDLIRRGINNIE